MKHTKTVIAVLLGLIMAIAPLSISAYAGGDGIEWTFSEVTESYHLLGEAKLGENVFPESYSAMTFTAKESGLYLVKVTSGGSLGFYGFSEKYDGNIDASGAKECNFAYADNEWAGDIYRFDKGETQVFGVDDIQFLRKATVTIEYLGKFKSLECTDKNRTYVIDQDIYGYKDGNGVNCVDFNGDIRLVTDKTDKYLVGVSSVTGKLYSGKCTLTAKLLGYKSSIAVKCIKVTDYIKKAEFPNDFVPVIEMYYDGTCNFSKFCPDTIDITLKNGKKKTIEADEYGYFSYEVSKDLFIYLGIYTWWNDDNQCDAYIGAGAEEWDRTPCTYEDVSFLENSGRLCENVISRQVDKGNFISGDFYYGGLIYSLRNIPIHIIETDGAMVEDIRGFCNYYLNK